MNKGAFNNTQIKSVNNQGTFDTENPNIYYQNDSAKNNNIVDLTNDFEKAPTIQDVRNYINELVESGKKFATLSPNWFVDVKGGAKKKDHIIKSSNFSKMSKAKKQRHKKFIMSLEKLLASAEYSGEKENTKKSKKPNIAKYHYFTTNVRVGDKIYKVVFDTEEYKNEMSSSSANVLRSVKNLDEDNNSITDNAENINPQTVHLYNITEYKTFNQEIQPSLFEGNPNIYYQSAYHGTPHRFEKFSTDNIGSGEGAQAHGWGLYFAGDKDISEGYRKPLAGDDFNNEQYYYNGELIEDRTKKAILSTIVKNGKDKVIQVREKSLEKYKYSEFEYQTKKEELEWIQTLDENKIEKKTNKGQLFEVDIPEIDEMLDENKPLKEQSKKVRKAILEYYKSRPNDYSVPKDENSLSVQTGKHFYEDVAFQLERENSLSYRVANGLNTDIDKNFNSQREASLLLNKLGIKGITYDGMQDGRCYVVFDNKAVNILKTYYQISKKTSEKAKEVVNALKKIADGSEEETVKNLRDDLNEYGGTNDVTFVFGDNKKGIKHIAQKHGTKTLLKVFDTVVDGKVLRFVPNKKTVILSKGIYEAVLSLDENGEKKTWLLSGWNTKEKSSDVSSEVSTQSTPTQIKPTFSRQDLGAELNNIINDNSRKFNPTTYKQEIQKELFLS